MAIEAVIVDLGGVWLQDGDFAARQGWADRLGMTADELHRTYLEAIGPGWEGGRSEAEIHERLRQACGIDERDLPTLLDALHAHETLDPELSQFLGGLRPALRVGVITNAGPSAREVLNRRFRLDERVDVLVVSAEEGVSKPDPAIYRAAAERLRTAPERCVFVDDKDRNVEGARAVGMHGVLFTSSKRLIADLDEILGPQD